MIDFTLWDILRNLLLAARWTLALSLIAFIGGSLVGLALTFLRLTRWPGAALFCRLYTELFQGTPLLMQLFLAFFGGPMKATPSFSSASANFGFSERKP